MHGNDGIDFYEINGFTDTSVSEEPSFEILLNTKQIGYKAMVSR